MGSVEISKKLIQSHYDPNEAFKYDVYEACFALYCDHCGSFNVSLGEHIRRYTSCSVFFWVTLISFTSFIFLNAFLSRTSPVDVNYLHLGGYFLAALMMGWLSTRIAKRFEKAGNYIICHSCQKESEISFSQNPRGLSIEQVPKFPTVRCIRKRYDKFINHP